MRRFLWPWKQQRPWHRQIRRRQTTFGMVAAMFLLVGLVRLPEAREASPFVFSDAYREDTAVLVAAQELSEAVANFKKAPEVRFFGLEVRSRPELAVVAGAAESREVQSLTLQYGLRLPSVGPEGYIIQPLPQANPPAVLVVSESALGAAYGLLALAEDLRLDRPYLRFPLPLKREPAMTLRLVANPLDATYPGPEMALKWGYNAILTEPWPSLALFDGFDPAIYSPQAQGEARAWVEQRRGLAHEQIARAKALHLQVIAPGDVISLPASVARLYGIQVTDGRVPPRYCIERPKVQALLAANLDEVFTEFPELDGIMIRTGENYPLGPLTGNIPQEARCSRGGDGQESLTTTLRFLYEQVVVKHGKLLVQRNWDLGNDGAHAQTGATMQLASALPPAAPPVYSFKISETDFWRYNGLNPNLLQQAMPRMVELQAAREYEGKGAFPNYVAGLYALGPPETAAHGGLLEAYRAGVRGAWVWAKGGGWDGPHLSNDLWVDANVYALSHLMWDVDAASESLAEDWATLRFGPQAAPHIAALLSRSADAALKGFYFQCYAARSRAWTPNLLWVRDDIITGGITMEQLYQSCRQEPEFSQALEEKRQAVAQVDAMLADFHRAQPFIKDAGLAQGVLVSLEYQRTLFESLEHYVTGMFNFYRFRESRGLDQRAKTTALQAFAQLRESWALHTQVIPSLPGAPTPYRDAGMLQTVRAAQQELEGH